MFGLCLVCILVHTLCCSLALLRMIHPPAVISPELIMEVEARMKRAHVPPAIVKSATALVPNRAKAFHHARAKKATSGLATVQEGSRIGKWS